MHLITNYHDKHVPQKTDKLKMSKNIYLNLNILIYNIKPNKYTVKQVVISKIPDTWFVI